ncbi:protein virilizer homolog [Salvia hispanica]|uniref:protein virilizer homolog n=1 Tax=Salvia hispanica TaxID=49212 RepID=UPI002009BAB5|nr:protein virilizer homolog [Salvia hispanica]
MRIRKNVKIAQLLNAASSLKSCPLLQPHICQLNQSPWDVITFSPPSSPPPPLQLIGSSDVRAGNGSSEHCVSVSESDTAAPPPPPPPPEEKEAILCCKTDGKSWHCQRETANGNSLCEHHLSMSRNYSSPAATKKSARPKRAPAAASSSNPHEFYYYSGFGPRWGKRRGEEITRNAETEEAAISYTGDEEFDFFADYEDEDEEEEDGEEEEEERRENGKEKKKKKRVRKPIKARSLKSLL